MHNLLFAFTKKYRNRKEKVYNKKGLGHYNQEYDQL